MAKYTTTPVGPASSYGNTQKAISIEGFDTIIKNLNIAILEMNRGSGEGLLHVAKHIRREMDTVQPLIPVDTGNLRASWIATPIKDAFGNKGVIMGFTANYALWVHEMVGADFTSPRWRYSKKTGKKYWYTPREGAGAKFLEAAINRNKEVILQIIADKMKVK